MGCPWLPVSPRLLDRRNDSGFTLICVPPTYSGTFPQIQVQPVYFNDPKVKAAIHAPADVEWTECTSRSVFVAPGDTSQPPTYDVIPRVIAHGVRTVVVTGLADFVLLSEGWVPISTPAFHFF